MRLFGDVEVQSKFLVQNDLQWEERLLGQVVGRSKGQSGIHNDEVYNVLQMCENTHSSHPHYDSNHFLKVGGHVPRNLISPSL